MQFSEACFKIAVSAFVVGVLPFSLTLLFRYLDDVPTSDVAFILVVGTVAFAVVSLFVGIIAKASEGAPSDWGSRMGETRDPPPKQANTDAYLAYGP
jgi:hypothetical protein